MNTFLRWGVRSSALLTALALGTVWWARRTFNSLVDRDVAALVAQTTRGREGTVTTDMLHGFPEPVRRYLAYTGVVGRPFARTVHVTQTGTMRLAASQPWIPLDAEVDYCTQPPSFVWRGTLHWGRLPLACARDMYLGGTGHMLVKVGALVTVVDARGEEMDRAAMMRYLNEMVWFPTAFLGDNIAFEPIDHTSARVTFRDGERQVSGTLSIDEEGRLTTFVAQQYRAVGGGFQLTTWLTQVTEYGELDGLKLPVHGQALWKLPEGNLAYADLAITAMHGDGGRSGSRPAAACAPAAVGAG